MSALTRRTFIAKSAAAVTLSKAALAMAKLQAGNLGVQLYTVRDIILKDPATVLKGIQDIGYTEVEAIYATLDKIWPALKVTKLKPVSVHVDTAIFVAGGDQLDTALGKAKEHGFKYVVVPYIPPAQRGGLDTFKRLAETLNKAGEKAKAQGLTLCYHNHAFEYEPMGGTTGIETMMKETHKGLVSLELDVFWTSVGGHDPVEMLNKYAGRIALLHLKDKKAGLATQYNENVPPETFKEVGNGSLDIPAILKAADHAGVQQYFVEQDQSPDPMVSLKQSFTYLSNHFAA